MANKKKQVVTSFNIAEQLRTNASKDKHLLSQDEIDSLDRGIPLTGMLLLQIIMRVNVIPLQHFFTITGKKDTGKSLLLWEMLKVFTNYGGLGVYVGTETNENVPKQKRALNIPPHAPMDNILYYRNTNTLDEFKDVMFKSNDDITGLDPDGEVPVLIAIDSLGNIGNKKARREMDAKELKKADSDNNMSAAQRAKKVKEFLQEFQVNYLNERPVTVVGINHWQDKIDITGMSKGGYSPGGVYKDYLNSSELFLARTGTQNINSGNSEFDVKFQNKKQACGPARKLSPIVTFTDWKKMDDDGNEYDCCGFNWNSGLVKLLLSGETNKAQLKDILDINKKGQVYSSETLKCEDVTADELGQLIHNNEEICDGIRKMFSVTKYATVASPLGDDDA